MKIWGIQYSWTAIAVRNVRPELIQWRSITGLQNYGIVRFIEQKLLQEEDVNDGSSSVQQLPSTTLMTMRMTFVAPRVVSAVFKQSTTLQHFVEEKIIIQSLRNFRDIVSKEIDSKKR
jgi:uncharacterized membrane protein